jgi:hypothetical protein
MLAFVVHNLLEIPYEALLDLRRGVDIQLNLNAAASKHGVWAGELPVNLL